MKSDVFCESPNPTSHQQLITVLSRRQTVLAITGPTRRIGIQKTMSAKETTPAHPTIRNDKCEELASSFHRDGYLVLPQLFSPSFTSQLLDECSTTFHAVLSYLHEHGEIDFAAASKLCADGSNKYQYPFGQGLKSGYRELVMRSPGRYEMALLVNDSEGKEKVLSAELLYDGDTKPQSCLGLLVEWIKNDIQRSYPDSSQSIDMEHSKVISHDNKQLNSLLNLINTIFSDSGNKSTKSKYHLVNLSLVISTPGSETQSWHADGGHVSLDSHALCHCFNVFIPLVDVSQEMGPTELRPGSHYYTRDLTKMMLGAMARKELRPTVTPELQRGDALIFDYRILHRGRANTSHIRNYSSETKDGSAPEHIVNTERTEKGRDRPILVMTFAASWFVDVCNFPKRSIFTL